MHTPSNCIFSSPLTNLIRILDILMKIVSHANAKSKTIRLRDFTVCSFFLFCFSSEIMAVKWLLWHHWLNSFSAHNRGGENPWSFVHWVSVLALWSLCYQQPLAVLFFFFFFLISVRFSKTLPDTEQCLSVVLLDIHQEHVHEMEMIVPSL